MIVYAISDLHGQLPAIPTDCQLLIIGGDVCPDFQIGGLQDKTGTAQADWLGTKFRAWLETAPCPVVSIWGNHDFIGEHPSFVPELPWTLLRDSEITLAGLRIYGTPWVPGLPYWAFYASAPALSVRAEELPADLDILITHGPPFGFGDFIPTSNKQREKYGNAFGMHVGDKDLAVALNKIVPGVTVCGHIHEARGTYMCGDATVYNVAAVDEQYVLRQQPFVRLYEFDG